MPGGLPRLEPPRTTGIRAGAAAAATITATAPRQNHQHKDTKNRKRGASQLPVLLICCVASEATLTPRMFSGDAHRKSGVIQLCFGSKPGGVMLPPEPNELTLTFTPGKA